MDGSRIDEDFRGPSLDPGLWVDHYLPQWTTPERSRARYELGPDGLRLRIDADQPPWRDADGPMRVSHVQTGLFSGPAGSAVGTHRHRADGLLVVSPQPTRRLWTPSAGQVAVRASASPDPACMVGIWLVGLEASSPRDSGELCLAELFGDRIGPGGSTVRVGVKAHHDPRLHDEVRDVRLPLDATVPHTYGVRWSADETVFTVDGAEVLRSDQRLGYELQLMLDLFELTPAEPRVPASYPKVAVVHGVHGVHGSAR